MFLMLLIAVVTSNVCGYFPHPYLFKCITPKPTLPANTCRPCGEVNKTNECAKVTDYCCYKGFWLEHTECPKNCTTPKPTVFPKCKLCSKSDKCASMRYVCDDGQWKIKYTCPSTCRTPKPIAIPKICRRCSNEKCASISYVCQSGKWYQCPCPVEKPNLNGTCHQCSSNKNSCASMKYVCNANGTWGLGYTCY